VTWPAGYEEPPPSDNCLRTIHEDLVFASDHPVGTEFELAQVIELHPGIGGVREEAEIYSRLIFGPLPPGVFLVRCDGDTTSVAVVGVGASSAASLRIDGVWPNPSRGEFRAALTAPTPAPAHVRVFDANGRVVESRVWYAVPGERRELSFGHSLAPGTYFLQVKQGALSAVREVVVLK
jgi:hypothetical protein